MAKITVRWAKEGDTTKFAKLDTTAIPSETPWNAVDFDLFLAEPNKEVLGLFGGRNAVGYACIHTGGRFWRIERLVAIRDGGEEDYDVFLLSALIEYVDKSDTLRIEIHVAEDDNVTADVLKHLGFAAEPWANASYVNKLGRYRLCYRGGRKPVT